MSLLIISYPELSSQDANWISAVRQRHGFLKHSVLAPHVTLVFPLSDITEDELVAHVGALVTGQPTIDFVLRSSLLVKDDSSDNYYVLLVPDEGFSSIVRLHDKLYTGLLTSRLRLDLPFIPHVTIGFSSDILGCKSVVDELNNADLALEGKIACLDVVRKEAETAWTVRRFVLGRTAPSVP